jgi:hypothetical protein
MVVLGDTGLYHMLSKAVNVIWASATDIVLPRDSCRLSVRSTWLGTWVLAGLVAAMNEGANLAKAFAALFAILCGGSGGAGGAGVELQWVRLESDMMTMTRQRAVAVPRSGHGLEGLSYSSSIQPLKLVDGSCHETSEDDQARDKASDLVKFWARIQDHQGNALKRLPRCNALTSRERGVRTEQGT